MSEPTWQRLRAPRTVHKTERTYIDRLLQQVAELQTRVAQKAMAATILADQLGDITTGLTTQVRIGCELADTTARLRAARTATGTATAASAPHARVPVPRLSARPQDEGDAQRQSWCAHPLSLVLPQAQMETMWDRAQQWSITAGGRFGASTSTIMMWSGPRQRRSDSGSRPAIVGYAAVEWDTPAQQEATISHIAWQPATGGSAALVWRLLEVLAGTTLDLSRA